jgi:hypothetical protein
MSARYRIEWDKGNMRWDAYLAECSCYSGKQCATCKSYDPKENHGRQLSKFYTLEEAIHFRNKLNNTKPSNTTKSSKVKEKQPSQSLEILESGRFPPCPTVERWCVRAMYWWQVGKLHEIVEKNPGTMAIELTYLDKTITLEGKIEASANGVNLIMGIFGSGNIMFRYEEWAL